MTLARHLADVKTRKSNVTKSGGLSARGRRAVGVSDADAEAILRAIQDALQV